MTDYAGLINAARYCCEADITECEKTCEAAGKGCVYRLISQCSDAIEELNKQCDALVTDNIKLVALLPRWISVEERLPEEDGDYLAYVCLDDNEPFYGIFPFDSNVPAFGYWDEYFDPGGWAGSDFIEMRGITHWMPLPPPPKEENENDKTDMR